MKKLLIAHLMSTLFAGLLTVSLVAQTTNSGSSSAGNQVTGNNTKDAAQAQTDSEPDSTVYVPALDGSGLIDLNSSAKTHLLVGGTYSAGWDSNPDDLAQGASSGTYVFSPYLGVQINSSKAHYILQYQPTIREYTSDYYAGGTMHLASLKVVGNFSDRWHWDLKSSGSHGQDSIRLLAPVQTEAIGNVAGTGAGSAAYLPNVGTVTYLSGEVGVHYDRSARDIIELRVANSYNKYSGLEQTSSIASTILSYQRAMSSSFSVTAYEQNSYYYGTINCGSFGFGIGANWKARENTTLSVSGGPQLNSSSCGKQQGFAYTAAFSTRLSAKSQVYATSSRQPTTTYLGPGLWQESASAGYQRELTPLRTFGVDVGYVSSDALTSADSYHGTYFDGTYSHHLGHALTASVGFRSYTGNWGQTNFSRHAALFSLAWTPGAGHLFQ